MEINVKKIYRIPTYVYKGYNDYEQGFSSVEICVINNEYIEMDCDNMIININDLNSVIQDIKR